MTYCGFKVVAISENVAIIGLKLITSVSVATISIIFATISLLHHLENFRLLIYFFQLPTTLASRFWSPTSLLQIFSSHPHSLSLSLSLSLSPPLFFFTQNPPFLFQNFKHKNTTQNHKPYPKQGKSL